MARPLPEKPAALLFAPMIYVAWADGDLDAREIAAIRGRILGAELPEPSRAALVDWLDPADPPRPGELAALLERIRARARDASIDRLTVRDLAEKLATTEGHRPEPAELEALGRLEEAVGLAPAERAAAILRPVRPAPAPTPVAPSFNIEALAVRLAGPRPRLRAEMLELLGRESMAPLPRETPVGERRREAQRRLGELAARGWGALPFPERYGGGGDLVGFMTAFSTLGYGNLDLLVKFGVQFGLFGLSIAALGTEGHHRAYLARAATLDVIGCYAMTESGHGSNVADLETVARYDPATREFVMNTPRPRARKDYVGNAARYARLAVVFAQLETRGQRHGVHAFVVPIRGAGGTPAPGILIEDCGEKIGLEGVDNGRLSFNQVRVPRHALLDRFGHVAADGTYESDIVSPGKRFFTMLGTLVGGRIAIATAAVSTAELALTIALRYATRRRQFGRGGEPELPLIDYPHHRRRLLPRLAETVALRFATRGLVSRFAAVGGDRELETRAAALKALATWHATSTIDECRQACGGTGYLAENRFGALEDDTDVFTTFEGDNVVLLLLVARSLLGGYAEGARDLGVLGFARQVAGRALAAFDRNPARVRRVDPDHLRSAGLQTQLFESREKDLLHSLAQRMKKRIDRGADAFTAMLECQEHALSLARAHGERLVLAAAVRAESHGGDLAPLLGSLRSLYALSALERDRAWFLENGYFEPRKSGAVRDQVDALCAELAPQAIHLVRALGIPDAVVRAPIGLQHPAQVS